MQGLAGNSINNRPLYKTHTHARARAGFARPYSIGEPFQGSEIFVSLSFSAFIFRRRRRRRREGREREVCCCCCCCCSRRESIALQRLTKAERRVLQVLRIRVIWLPGGFEGRSVPEPRGDSVKNAGGICTWGESFVPGWRDSEESDLWKWGWLRWWMGSSVLPFVLIGLGWVR